MGVINVVRMFIVTRIIFICCILLNCCSQQDSFSTAVRYLTWKTNLKLLFVIWKTSDFVVFVNSQSQVSR